MSRKDESEPLLPLAATHPTQPSSTSSRTNTTPTPARKLTSRRTSSSASPSNTGTYPRDIVQSEKSKGKQKAVDSEDPSSSRTPIYDPPVTKRKVGRHITVIFSGDDLIKPSAVDPGKGGADGQGGGGHESNLDLWVEDGESVGSVKDQASLAFRFLYHNFYPYSHYDRHHGHSVESLMPRCVFVFWYNTWHV